MNNCPAVKGGKRLLFSEKCATIEKIKGGDPVGKKRRWLLAALVLLVILLGAEVFRSNRCLAVDHYQVESAKLTENLRIVQLADLHNAEFGVNNEDLLDRVAEQEPDLIFFTGDLVKGQIKETDVAMDLVEQLVKIAPVYISIGNHEQIHQSNFGSDLVGMLEYRGATVLEFGYQDVEVKGQSLRIGGISGYCVPEKYLSTGEARADECAFLNEFTDTDRCTLLLCHMPVCWIRNDGISQWDADLVFAGHAHGGQIVLPFVGGVYAPDMGFFPGRLEGLYPSDDGTKTLVLTSGLGTSLPIPRFNNPPQILVLDILAA